MADDLVSTEPAGGPSAELGDNKVGDQWKKGWRSLFLLGVTFALVLLGYVFWKASAIGKEAPNISRTRQLITVCSTDPKATIHLTTEVFWRNLNGFHPRLPYEIVYVSATVPNAKNSPAIFIASSLRPVALMRDADGKLEVKSDQSYRRAVFYNGIDKYRALRPIEYVSELSLADITKNGRGERFGFPVATVELPQITQESRGSFFAHLPLIGIIAGSSYKLPFLISEDRSSSDDEKLIEFPRLKNGRYPSYPDYGSRTASDYRAPRGQHLEKVYWQPESLTTTVILHNVKSEFQNATVNSVVPSNGHFAGFDYVWQGREFLEPTMSLTNQDAAASHDDWVFRSGIAFGVAAGTGVAFVQEENNLVLNWLGRFFSSLWLTIRKKRHWPGMRRRGDQRGARTPRTNGGH